MELKRGFTIELLYQAIDRQRLADSVYVAVPLPKRGYMAPHLADMKALCRRLSLGLIFVGFTSTAVPMVDVFLHPDDAAAPGAMPSAAALCCGSTLAAPETPIPAAWPIEKF